MKREQLPVTRSTKAPAIITCMDTCPLTRENAASVILDDPEKK